MDTFRQYAELADQFDKFRGEPFVARLPHLTLGLLGELGEVRGARGKRHMFSIHDDHFHEVGDVLWYLGVMTLTVSKEVPSKSYYLNLLLNTPFKILESCITGKGSLSMKPYLDLCEKVKKVCFHGKDFDVLFPTINEVACITLRDAITELQNYQHGRDRGRLLDCAKRNIAKLTIRHQSQ